jgi:hypothetical protein
MAELKSNASSPKGMFSTKAGSKSYKLPSKEDTGTSPLNPNEPFENLIHAHYLDHMFCHRSAILLQALVGPLTRHLQRICSRKV